jgi:ADP-heptose:LPS heptosyltransferase
VERSVADAGKVHDGAGSLAIHPGALGDVLLAIPALRALRATRPPVTLAAQPHIGGLLRILGVVDEAVAFESLGLDALFVDDRALASRLPAVERVVCWFGARDAVFTRRLRTVAPDAVIAPAVITGRPVWEHLLATVDAPPGEWRAPIASPDEIRALGLTALTAAGPAMLAGGTDAPRPWLFVHPGAGSVAKQWPPEAFAQAITTVTARRSLNVLVHQGPADAAAASALRRHLGDRAVGLVNPPLPALAGALAHAHLFLGNDSGVSHLAAALGVPALVLFDPRQLDWRPWWAGARVRTVTLTQTVPGDVAAVVDELERALT